MTDKKEGPLLPDGENDWQHALDEWDEKAFAPEVAHDQVTRKPATPLAGPSSARPLYRPPSGPIAPPPASRPLPHPAGGPASRPHAGMRLPDAGAEEHSGDEDFTVVVPYRASLLEEQARAALAEEEKPPARAEAPPTVVVRDDREPLPEDAGQADAHAPPFDDGIDALLDRGLDPPSEPPPVTPEPAGEPAAVDDAVPEPAPLPLPSEPAIPRLTPSQRKHDPDAETSVRSLSLRIARERAAALAAPLVQFDDDEDDPDDVEEVARAPIEIRANMEWLAAEAEARTGADRARILLAMSEIEAISGDPGRAAELAASSRDAAPDLLLAHKQARALATPSPDRAELAELLKNEAMIAEAPEARRHALLLAANALRSGGDEAAAVRAWDEILEGEDDDPRAATAKAAYLLARGDLEALAALSKAPAAAQIREGITGALALRGASAAPLPETDGLASVRPNDALRRAREALRARDMARAGLSLEPLRQIPELARAADWLSAAVGAAHPETLRRSAEALERLVADGDDVARRALAARAIELGDRGMAEVALDDHSFSTADRAVIRTLLDLDPAAREVDAEALAITGPMAPLAFAVAAESAPRPPSGGSDAATERSWIDGRAERVAGGDRARAEVRLARLLAAHAPDDLVAAAIGPTGSSTLAEAAGISIEMDARGGAWDRVAAALESWPSAGSHAHPGDGPLAAGLVAERAGLVDLAVASYWEAFSADAPNEGLVRALDSLERAAPPNQRLNKIADALGDSIGGALARLEGALRAEPGDPVSGRELLEQAHRAAPSLPMASFLARRDARRSGDMAELLRWMDETRAQDSDASERALIAAGQARLLAKTDPATAAARAEEAHLARPQDVALRELYERLSPERTPDQGSWREARAGTAVGDARAIFYMEAAHRYELLGDKEAALRAAEAAVASGDSVLARLARERAELEAGAAARLADELLVKARETESPEERREAYMRLADLDAVGRGDPASALLWHRSILEDEPGHKPSLRHLEHALIGGGRDDELEPIVSGIARALDGKEGAETVAHADLAARLRARGVAGDWDATRELAELAARQHAPSLSSQRLLNAHGRFGHDDGLILRSTLALIGRATRPSELAVLLLRAGETAARLGDLEQATHFLERARAEDPGDVSLWGALSEVRQRAGDARGAAEASESLARTSTVPEHRLVAWYDAGTFWLDEVHDGPRGVAALEQAAAIDVTYADVFPRLSALYSSGGDKAKLAELLERRIGTVSNPHERVAMEVEMGRTLAEVGDTAGARRALASALEIEPDSTAALGQFADLSAREQDWDAAEQAWVRLARLLAEPEEQRQVYARLGHLYAHSSVNLERAELALKEVLRRAPADVATLEQLVDVYRRRKDAAQAVDVQQQLVALARDPADRRGRLIELANLHEASGNDTRKAEQVLESARREFPMDVTILRALAEFYIRHKQMPAVHILLDRASADARRAFAAGRFAPELFEIMRAAFDLRGRRDASRVVAATLAAFDGQPAIVRGAEARALDPELDDKLAPEVLSPALRTLLLHAGAALNAAVPLDLRPLQPGPLGPSGAAVRAVLDALAAAAGLPPPVVQSSPSLGLGCVVVSSDPPTLIVGDDLSATTDHGARAFVLVRAMKLVATRAAVLIRTPSAELGVLVAAWLQAFNPSWTPQGVNPVDLAAASKRIAATFPKKLPPDLGMLALEVAGSLGVRASTLGAVALALGNRTALLAVGDPNAALQAIAWSQGARDGAPTDPKERGPWIARTYEAKDLLTFSVGDAYAEARERLGLDK